MVGALIASCRRNLETRIDISVPKADYDSEINSENSVSYNLTAFRVIATVAGVGGPCPSVRCFWRCDWAVALTPRRSWTVLGTATTNADLIRGLPYSSHAHSVE